MDLSDYTFTSDLSRASTIPARWYTDPAFLEAERGSVFGRTWQAVGHADWVAAPGSYFACEITG
jgi:choline monooxygenase